MKEDKISLRINLENIYKRFATLSKDPAIIKQAFECLVGFRKILKKVTEHKSIEIKRLACSSECLFSIFSSFLLRYT